MSEDRKAGGEKTGSPSRKGIAIVSVVIVCLVDAVVVLCSSPSDGTGHNPPGCRANSPQAQFEADAVHLNETYVQTRLTHVGGDPIPAHEMYVSYEGDEERIPLSRAISGDPPRGNVTTGDVVVIDTASHPEHTFFRVYWQCDNRSTELVGVSLTN